MSRHDQDLTDMHELLQQMKDMHDMDLHDLDHREGVLNMLSQATTQTLGLVTDQDVLEYYFKHDGENEREVLGVSEENKNVESSEIDMEDNSQKGLLIKFCSITKQKKVLDILKSKHPGEHNLEAHNKHDSDKKIMIHILKSVTEADTITSIFTELNTVQECRKEMMDHWTIPDKEGIKKSIKANRKSESAAKKEARKGKYFWQK